MNSGKSEQSLLNGENRPLHTQTSNSKNIATQLKNFSQGDTSALETPGLVEVIVHYIFKLYRNGKMGDTLILLEQLGETAKSGPKTHKERALIILSLAAEKILAENNEDLLEPISQMLTRWLKSETEYVAGFEFICFQLSKLIHRMLEAGLWYQVEDLISVLRDIKKGVIEKDKLLKQIISRTHTSIAEDDFLDRLTWSYVDENNSKSDIAGILLIHLYDKSTPHLLQTLAQCQDKSQRFRLLDLIPAAGHDAVPTLVEGLQNKSPWYVTRNIILMLARIGDPALYNSIKPFLQHQDIRVQKEAVKCIQVLSGGQKVSRLLEALTLCDHRLKPRIINMLGPLGDKRIATALLDVLTNISVLDQNLQNDIIQTICRYLPDYKHTQSFTALEKLVADTNLRRNLSEKTLTEIEKACAALQKIDTNHSLPDWVVAIEPADDPASAPPTPAQQRVEVKNNTPPPWFLEATQRQRHTPEPLRQHLLTRKRFYCRLTNEEYLVFSALLTHKTYAEGAKLASVGDVHSTLFFIEKGSVDLFLNEKKKNFQSYRLIPGSIFGHGVFMNGSEWSVALTANEETEAFLFDQEKLLSLQSKYPNLCRKILEYCRKNDLLLKLHLTVEKNHDDISPDKTISFTGDIGDHIADAIMVDQSSHGFCFCFNLPQGIDGEIFADKNLYVRLQHEQEEIGEVKARIVGLEFFEKENRKLCVMASFLGEKQPAEYSCTAISL